MINRDTAFVDLLKQENLSKLLIDKRLIPYFANTMRRMQSYFADKNYMQANNYAMLFEKFLLARTPDQFQICIGSLGEKTEGTYNQSAKKITISQSLFQKPNVPSSKIEEVICHEFIHFLTMTDYPFIEQKDGSFKQDPLRYTDPALMKNTFILEAYTEGLNQMIYPQSGSYEPQVKMIRFASYILQAENNYFSFLRGQMPGVFMENKKIHAFKNYVEKYTAEVDKDYSMATAAQNASYLQAQTALIDLFEKNVKEEIRSFQMKEVADYVERVYKLAVLQPVKTPSLHRLIDELHTEFIDSYFCFTPNVSELSKQMMKEKLALLCKYAYQYNSQIMETINIENPYVETTVDVKKQNVLFHFGPNVLSFAKLASVSKQIRVPYYDNEKQLCYTTLDISIVDGKLVVVVYDPVMKKFEYDISQERYQKINSVVQGKITDLLDTFKKVQKREYVDIAQMLKQDKSISIIRQVIFPDEFGNADGATKIYISEGLYNDKKVWFMEDGKVQSADLDNIMQPAMKPFLTPKRLPTHKLGKFFPMLNEQVMGKEILAGKTKLFVYVRENQPGIAKIDENGQVLLPLNESNLYQTNQTILFGKMLASPIKLNGDNDKIF